MQHDAQSDLRREVYELADACLAGAATDAQRTQLEALVVGNPEARRHYAEFMMDAVGLEEHLAAESATPPTALEPAGNQPGRAAAPAGISLVRGIKLLAHDFVREPVALAVIVLVMISGGVLFWNLSQRNPQTASGPGASGSGEPRASARGGDSGSRNVSNSPVGPRAGSSEQTPPGANAPGSPKKDAPRLPVIARLTRSVGAAWDQPSSPDDGATLIAGQKLHLKQGLAEIAFESGVTVVLEGPAEFELGGPASGVRGQGAGVGSPGAVESDRNACALSLGKLVARVPGQARGFTVQTPTMTVVDLGTEFGVAVKPIAASPPVSSLPPSASSTTEVHVLLGEVRVMPEPVASVPAPQSEIGAPAAAGHLKSEILKAGEAIIGGPAGKNPRRIQAQPGRFVRKLPGTPLAPLATWPKDGPLKPGDIVAAARGSNRFRLFKIDPQNGQQQLLAEGFPYRQAAVDHGLNWRSVAVEPDGHVLVGVNGLGAKNAGVLRIDPRNGQIGVLTSGGMLTQGSINGLAVAEDGAIYASYETSVLDESDQIVKIDPVSGEVTPLARFGANITGICFDANNQPQGASPRLSPAQTPRNLVAGSTRDSRLGFIEVVPEPKITAWPFDPSHGQLASVVVNREGRMFVGAALPQPPGQHVIYEAARDAQHTVKRLAEVPGWSGTLVCEPDGNLLVGPGHGDRRLHRVDCHTGELTLVSTGGMLEEETFLAVVPGRPAATPEETR